METLKWLDRKYPKSNDLIKEDFSVDTIEKEIKIRKCKVAIINQDVTTMCNATYKKGTICLVKRSKAYSEEGTWDSSFDTYFIFKCDEGLTASGYHSFQSWGVDYTVLED